MWDLSCPDWETRIREGRSLVPDLPLVNAEAEMALRIFDELQLPDQEDLPFLRDAAGQWFRDIVRAAFGSWNPELRLRFIRDILAMLPKGSSKTTYSAGFCLTCLMMNLRPRAEALFVAPSHAIAENAYDKAVGMIDLSRDLKKRFRPRDHIKTIEDLSNGSELKIKTFDVNILTGSILILALLDEIHLLGAFPQAAKVLRQIRGGLEKTPEGVLLMTTTQSDSPPSGVWKDELITARKIRDGDMRGKVGRPMLPVLYEFPDDIARNPHKWQNPANWPMVMPNLGRSVQLDSLVADWETEKAKGVHAIVIWASQHLNIEIGVGQKTDAWKGAKFWEAAEDPTLTYATLLERSDAVVIGADGGGLDDLFGAAAVGREKLTKTWLGFGTAWAHETVLEERKSIASRLQDFDKDGELFIIDEEFVDIYAEVEDLLVSEAEIDELLLPKDVAGIVIMVAKAKRAGKLAAVALDMEGPYSELMDALSFIGVTAEAGLVVGVGQGIRLMHALKGSERKLANKTMKVAKSGLMRWCVANVKIEATATAIRATKQNAGDAKIDPVMALLDAISVMQTNPVVGRSVYDQLGDGDEDEADDDQPMEEVDMSVLRDPSHPDWAKAVALFNAALDARGGRDEDYA